MFVQQQPPVWLQRCEHTVNNCLAAAQYCSAVQSVSLLALAPMVVGRLAAQTPSRLSVRSSRPLATTRGGTHWKQAVSPGMMVWMWPLTASSLTPLSIHVWPSSRHTCGFTHVSTLHVLGSHVKCSFCTVSHPVSASMKQHGNPEAYAAAGARLRLPAYNPCPGAPTWLMVMRAS